MNRNTGSRIRVAYGRAIIAGASLTQNAALANVEKAIGRLLATDVISRKVYWQLLMTSCSYTSCSPISVNSFHMLFNPSCDSIRLIVVDFPSAPWTHSVACVYAVLGSGLWEHVLRRYVNHRVMRSFLRRG